MRCTKATYQLQLYIDHQLTLRQTRVLEAHIASCSSCRAELNLLEEVSCGLNTLKFVSEPANMHEEIMQRVALTTAEPLRGRPGQAAKSSRSAVVAASTTGAGTSPKRAA